MWGSIIVSSLKWLSEILTKFFIVRRKQQKDEIDRKELDKKIENNIKNVNVDNNGTEKDPFNDEKWNKGGK